MGLDNRVRRLEAVSWGKPCPECGFDGNHSKTEIEVSVRGIDEERDLGPDNCSECGRVLVIRVPDLKRASNEV